MRKGVLVNLCPTWRTAWQIYKTYRNTLILSSAQVTAFIDFNGLQIDGNIEDIKGLDKIKEKFESFGFKAIRGWWT